MCGQDKRVRVRVGVSVRVEVRQLLGPAGCAAIDRGWVRVRG
jgi:hypothetical protein